ncbi:MAG: hypothetical protein EBY83_05745, partial [Verrucomicrobia bacterium]|nr:hypothetical protein [Verrucomicrobiota bacterium]
MGWRRWRRGFFLLRGFSGGCSWGWLWLWFLGCCFFGGRIRGGFWKSGGGRGRGYAWGCGRDWGWGCWGWWRWGRVG